MAASGGSILPADVAEAAKNRIQMEALRTYNLEPSMIPEVMEVRDFRPGKLYEKSVYSIADTKMEEREIGSDVKMGRGKEKRVVLTKRRFYSIMMKIPAELVEVLQASDNRGRGMDELIDLIVSPAAQFGRELARRQEETAADLFNKGGLAAGDSDTFDNSVWGGQIEQDASGPFIFDGKPAFTLAGNEHVSAGGGLYINHLPNVLSPANVDAAMIQLEDQNAYDELDRRIALRANTLLVAPAGRPTAENIVENNFLPEPGTQLSSFNPRARLQVKVWSYLTNPAAWFVGTAGRGAVFYRGGPPTIKFGERLEDNSLKVFVQGSWGFSWDDWRYWVANNLPT